MTHSIGLFGWRRTCVLLGFSAWLWLRGNDPFLGGCERVSRRDRKTGEIDIRVAQSVEDDEGSDTDDGELMMAGGDGMSGKGQSWVNIYGREC